MTELQTMLTLKGKGNKRGCAVGKTAYIQREEYVVASPAGEAKRESTRLRAAIAESREELFALYRALCSEAGEGEAWIFLMQIYLLDGSLFSAFPDFYIAEGKSADEALLLSYKDFFREHTHTPFVQDIREDVRDVTYRVIRHLSGRPEQPVYHDNFILLSQSPTSSEIYRHRDAIIGVVAKEGWENTNAAALARTLLIPAVITGSDFGENEANKNAIIDSSLGCAYIDPDLHTLECFAQGQKKTAPLPSLQTKKSTIPLLAESISMLEASRVHESELSGIGLLHSEELYLRRVSPPDEEYLFEVYRSLAESLLPRPLVIRTFSVSGNVRINKIMSEEKSEPELYVFHDETLTRQIRAVLRAAVFGTLALAVPCGNSYGTINKVRELSAELSVELRTEEKEHRTIPIGVIIDNPAAAIACDKLIDLSDFIILKKSAVSFGVSDGDIAADANRYILERVARTAKRKKKQALLCLEKDDDISDMKLATRLGFSALVISPDVADRFS